MINFKNSLKIILLFIVLILFIIFFYFYSFNITIPKPIKVGILHSRTGTLAISEEPLIKSTLLAIKEINADGGVLGRRLEPIIVDAKSNTHIFAKEAERLIKEEKVAVIFGCWSSSSRKAVKPIVEKYNNLLFYPVEYEGLESSPNIIYTGESPNQQIIPSLVWTINNFGKKIFLVGSDYIFPRVANQIIKEIAPSLGGHVIGEEYIKLGSKEVLSIVNKIKELQPDIILNTLNGDSNISFFNNTQLNIPIFSFSLSEIELPFLMLNTSKLYTSWSYFQSLDTKPNKKFLNAIHKEYGINQLVNDPMEAAYFGAKLWANAANKANSISTQNIKNELYNINFLAPEGFVKIDPNNNHTWKTILIGKARPDGQFDIIWDSKVPVKPEPYPSKLLITEFANKKYKTFDWQKFIKNLYKKWGNKWEA